MGKKCSQRGNNHTVSSPRAEHKFASDGLLFPLNIPLCGEILASLRWQASKARATAHPSRDYGSLPTTLRLIPHDITARRNPAPDDGCRSEYLLDLKK